jgi:tRNA wybutosine-synthesizing protein 2
MPINQKKSMKVGKRKASTSKADETTKDFFSSHTPSNPSTLLSTFPKRWTLYPPLILLPNSSFSTAEWKQYLSSLPDAIRSLFYAKLTSTLKGTHLAINAPILSTVLRSPQITPLHGNFGPVVLTNPTPADFEAAFWVTSTQNGIKQTWAPIYTMFSRGNMSEKTRILEFPGVKGEEVADLFVGIGYFAFSYLKAGAKRVWGWDLNGWSVEGLKRGAHMNGWSCIVNNDGGQDDVGQDARLVVFNEDNGGAVERLGKLGVSVRHVNLGLLPSSQLAWKTATEILDPRGGWIHVHGNCKDNEIYAWSEDVVKQLQGLFDGTWKVDVVKQFQVKGFAPGIGHWVLDLACSRS